MDKLADVRGRRVDIQRKKMDCQKCQLLERIGEYAWIVEVLAAAAGVTGDELQALFAEAHRSISQAVPRD